MGDHYADQREELRDALGISGRLLSIDVAALPFHGIPLNPIFHVEMAAAAVPGGRCVLLYLPMGAISLTPDVADALAFQLTQSAATAKGGAQ